MKIRLPRKEFHYSCPFQGSLNVCRAMEETRVNACPTTIDEDTGEIGAPNDCPIRKESITVELEREVLPNPYNKLIYRYSPNGYGDWGSPYGYVKEYVETLEGYDFPDGKQTANKWYLTEYYVMDHHSQKCRLYVPVGMKPEESGLELL